jgi:hypothetical protein
MTRPSFAAVAFLSFFNAAGAFCGFCGDRAHIALFPGWQTTF